MKKSKFANPTRTTAYAHPTLKLIHTQMIYTTIYLFPDTSISSREVCTHTHTPSPSYTHTPSPSYTHTHAHIGPHGRAGARLRTVRRRNTHHSPARKWRWRCTVRHTRDLVLTATDSAPLLCCIPNERVMQCFRSVNRYFTMQISIFCSDIPVHVARCMRAALRYSGLEEADVDYVNAHATSTPGGDAAEAAALTSVFGECWCEDRCGCKHAVPQCCLCDNVSVILCYGDAICDLICVHHVLLSLLVALWCWSYLFLSLL